MFKWILSGFGIVVIAVNSLALETNGWLTQPTLHGEEVVFASEGDLWVATIPTEATEEVLAHRLTSVVGEESHPIFSPDGSLVAFSGVYDGNRDVYVMPVRGGAPTRLTFHPSSDIPMSFSPDGRFITFNSARVHPLGRSEGYRVPVKGGLPERLTFGECTQLDFSSTGRQIAFTPYSNEDWNWRNYRGGTAPDIWIGVPEAGEFKKLTNDDANDLFPMWTGSRITFLSDRTGAPNLHSVRPDGSDPKVHTTFATDPENPTAIAGYELRWPSRDRARGGKRVVFSQGGELGVLDPDDDSVQRLPIRLVSDRARSRVRSEDALEALDAFSISPDGTRVLLEARGELMLVPILGVSGERLNAGSPRQLTHSPGVRERDAAWIDQDSLVLISDAAGEQQVGRLNIDEPGLPLLLTEDREDWLIDIKTSLGGRWAALADRTGRLHLLDLATYDIRQVALAEAGEIVDFSFSPDDEWLAFSMPNNNGMQSISLHSTRTDRTIPVSSGLTNDHSPKFGRDGTTLFFLSERNLNPTLGTRDFEHVFLHTTEVFAAPLESSGAPPLPEVSELIGEEHEEFPEEGEEDEEIAPEPEAPRRMKVDPEGLLSRAVKLPIPPGNYEFVEAIPGALLLLERPTQGLLEEVWPAPPLGAADGKLYRYDIKTGTGQELMSGVSEVSVARFRPVALVYGNDGFNMVSLEDSDLPPLSVDLQEVPMLVDVQAEWAQIFDESWRLQRDFFWAPNMRGIDWDAMRTKYSARLGQIGTRAELNQLIGEMLAELGTSHTYIWGGDDRNQGEPIDVGLLGADLVLENGNTRIRNRLSAPDWSGLADGPVAPAWVGVPDNSILRSIDGRLLVSMENPYALLQGKAGAVVTLGISSEPGGEITKVRVRPIPEERSLRYANWVESNRRFVAERTDDRVGYLHLPDMDGEGLSMFGKLFYPQVKKDAMIVDVRDNGGGFVSQMIIARLARHPWAYGKPRHGAAETYPSMVLDGPMVVLINQHAGSDGDIFPESFKMLDLGPLVGTRTWGGVIGIRADKPSVDGGITTQPEYAWWEPNRGWSLENSGVSPDIEVEMTPADRQDGRDRQLERGLKEIMETLQKNPPKKPTPPPYPKK